MGCIDLLSNSFTALFTNGTCDNLSQKDEGVLWRVPLAFFFWILDITIVMN